MTRPTVLITGISGFIAKHCAVEMLKAGYGVRGTVRSLSRSADVKASLGNHADVARLEFVAGGPGVGRRLGRERSPAAPTCCTSPRRSPRSSPGTSRN